ncbi:MAG: MBL fold metallo-hydrolase [Deltaproteobacteria bacterium]|nr:MBL fold metallo-hydrolase [Deltaproteobacteria bacterium]
MRAVDKLTVHVLVDNTTDMLSSRPAHVIPELRVLMEAGMEELAGEALCSAQHGLALLLTAEVGQEKYTVLFDGGPDPYTIERNGRHMGIAFGEIDAVVLSHGHFDHSEGLPKALQMIREANGEKTVPLYVHPGAFVDRAMRLRDESILPLQAVPSMEAFKRHGAQVIASAESEEILNGTFYLSGEIPRVSFERGLKGHLKKSPDGDWEDDPWIIDERFLAVQVRGKGLVICTGCSHAGIINILTHARQVFPESALYGVIGGLHLVSPNEDIIPETVREIKAFAPEIIIAGHCTGWRGIYALINAFGEAVVDPLAVGSRHML